MTTYSYCEKDSICLRDTQKVNVAQTVKEIAGLLTLFAFGTAFLVVKALIYVNF